VSGDDFHAPQEMAERVLVASEQRLAAQSAALTRLMARYADSPDSFDERIRGILAITAQTLGADRLSMWRFENGRDQIVCVDLYTRIGDRHGSGLRLSRAAAPRYFEALDGERIIEAHDARHDPRTSEFLSGYLEPNGIHSMLDVPLRLNGVSVGVLCAEQTSPRTWMLDEGHFAIAIAHLVVAAVADEERRAAVARRAQSESRAPRRKQTPPAAVGGKD
jgi:two-component system sensor histidine kinase/response regulator